MRGAKVFWGALAAGLAMVAGCAAPEAEVPRGPVAQVRAGPSAGGAAEVSPSAPITAEVVRGRFDLVTLMGSDGSAVTGRIAPDGRSWQATEPLAYDTSYTWSGQAIGSDGKLVPVGGAFSTVAPKRTTGATVSPTDGQQVGIAMPISVKFDEPVQDKAAVQRALSVETSVPVEGAWAWLADDEAHWRPREYWPAGTQVQVHARLFGAHFGGGVYGEGDLRTEFEIGRAQIVKADVDSHQLVVERDGEQVASYPASYGLESDPGRHTSNGTYVVMARVPLQLMTNPKYGYFDLPKKWAVRISNHGEFIHENQANAAALGSYNNSHGCINLSAANAKEYYDSALIGDPVVVTGSGTDMEPGYAMYDWLLNWEEWTAKSAV
ncbi:L,D-transpeptidase [Saccharopolyspora sp. CA-218241]|uniref:L,D-transpeptidase n=1 Tax=Saccharopolyspora sp. CA-218241 TaxID=3240027 RepID=UPI003D98ED0D